MAEEQKTAKAALNQQFGSVKNVNFRAENFLEYDQ